MIQNSKQILIGYGPKLMPDMDKVISTNMNMNNMVSAIFNTWLTIIGKPMNKMN